MEGSDWGGSNLVDTVPVCGPAALFAANLNRPVFSIQRHVRIHLIWADNFMNRSNDFPSQNSPHTPNLKKINARLRIVDYPDRTDTESSEQELLERLMQNYCINKLCLINQKSKRTKSMGNPQSVKLGEHLKLGEQDQKLWRALMEFLEKKL